MAPDPLSLIEQDVANIALRHADYPVELAMVLRMTRLLSWQMSRSANALLKTWGITYVEYSVLSTLYGRRRQTMSITELSDVIGEPPGHVKRLTVALSARGWVIRTCATTDRRKVMAALSDSGATLMQSILPVVSGMTADLVNSFAPGELATLLTLLKKLTIGAS